jgi:hypothetical protein
MRGERPLGGLSSLANLLRDWKLPRRAIRITSTSFDTSDGFERLQAAIQSPGFIAYLERSILDSLACRALKRVGRSDTLGTPYLPWVGLSDDQRC